MKSVFMIYAVSTWPEHLSNSFHRSLEITAQKEDVMEIFENRPRVLHATLWRLWPPHYLLLSEQIEVRQSGDLHCHIVVDSYQLLHDFRIMF